MVRQPSTRCRARKSGSHQDIMGLMMNVKQLLPAIFNSCKPRGGAQKKQEQDETFGLLHHAYPLSTQCTVQLCNSSGHGLRFRASGLVLSFQRGATVSHLHHWCTNQSRHVTLTQFVFCSPCKCRAFQAPAIHSFFYISGLNVSWGRDTPLQVSLQLCAKYHVLKCFNG